MNLNGSGKLPVGWIRKRIGEIGKVQTGSTPKTSENDNFGNYIPFIKPPDFFKNGSLDYENQGLSKLGLNKARVVDINSVLMVCIGATIGKVGFTERKVTTNQQINSLTPLNGDCAKFLFYQMLTEGFQKKVLDASGQATLPIINKTKWSNLSLYLPPLLEQKRIVAILDEAFEGIDRAIANTEKNLANSRELFESVIQNNIFADKSNETWDIKTVADVVLTKKGSIRTGPFGSQLLHSEFVDEGIAVLGIDNAVENEFKWGKRRFITAEKFRQLSRYQVKPGDVLITIMGTCGRCAIVPNDIPIAINTKHLCCITLDQKQCLPGFLHNYFLYHPIAQRYLAERAKGSIMSGLNMEIIKALPLHIPSISKQQIIIEKVNLLSGEIRNLETIYQQKLASLKELKQSILQKAFTGELTQDTVKAAKEEVAA